MIAQKRALAVWLTLSYFLLSCFGSSLEAGGADFYFFAGDSLGMQIDALGGFGLDIGVRDVIGASHASAANGTGFGHKNKKLKN